MNDLPSAFLNAEKSISFGAPEGADLAAASYAAKMRFFLSSASLCL